MSLDLEFHATTAVLRLRRPEAHNAVDDTMMTAIAAALDRIESSETRAVILTGTGETFSAGGDLRYFGRLGTSAEAAAMSRRMQGLLDRLASGPRPVIAALDGHVIGGGCEIALACHLRIAAQGVRFVFKPATLGIIPGWGGGLRLFRLLGRAAALRLLLLAETIEAEEALRLALIDRIAPRGGAVKEALGWAERIAALSAASISAILELDRAVRANPDDAAVIERETRLFAELFVGDDFRRTLADWQSKN